MLIPRGEETAMGNTQEETTPLLPPDDDAHSALFDKLEYHLDKDHIHDVPVTPRVKHVKNHLTHATLPAGHGHPMHHHLQSPALLLRLEQAIEHGFTKVVHAIKCFFKSKVATPTRDERMQSTYTVVLSVFVIAVLTMLAMTAVGPTLLLYMNHAGYTNAENISAYVLASAISTAVPIASNIILGFVASRFGPGRSIAFGSAFSALGMLIVILSRESILFFFIGYAMYSCCNSLRVIRVSLLTKVVPENERTTVLATHALMTPIGALMGPLLWIAIQTYRGSVPLLGGAVHFNRFTIDYSFACTALLTIAIVAVTMLHHIVAVDGSSDGVASASAGSGADNSLEAGEGPHEVTLHYTSGQEEVVNLDRYKKNVFWYFCGMLSHLTFRLAMGFERKSFSHAVSLFCSSC